MPARIVLACWGSYGDLFPYIGLALELRRAGHAPVVASCSYYRALVEAEGLAFAPLRPDVDPSDAALVRRIIDRRHGPEVVIREIVVGHVREMYRDIADAAAGADLIVSHPLTFAAPIVAEERGLPWVSTVLSPLSFFSAHDFPVLPAAPALAHLTGLGPWMARFLFGLARRMTAPWLSGVYALRAERGLPRGGDPLYEGLFSPYGTLGLFSPVIGPPQPDWPAGARATGFIFYNRAIPMPDELNAFLDAGEPPIVFTLGSSAVLAPGAFFEESARAAAALRRRAVLLTGLDPAARPARLPADALAVAHAPHDALFARAAAIVHPGGIGTTGQALRSGRPMLVVPYAHDQPDNAARVQRLGVARVLDPRRYRARAAVRHLTILLENSTVRARAATIGEQVRAEQGVRNACDVLTSVLGARPVTREPGPAALPAAHSGSS